MFLLPFFNCLGLILQIFFLLIFLDYISPFNICCKAGLVVLNFLNFCLSEKLLISPSILTEILSGYSNLGCRFFPLNISCHSLLAYTVSAERSAVEHMGFPLYVTCCFSLAAFNFLLLYLVFVSLISICLGVFLLGFNPLQDSLCLLDLVDYFLFHVGEIFNYNLFKIFLIPFLFLFLFWDPIIRMLVHVILSQRSLRPSSVLFIVFTLFCSSEVISTFYLPAHRFILLLQVFCY